MPLRRFVLGLAVGLLWLPSAGRGIGIDRNRLEKLSPADPKAYHDYAKELAGQKNDPEARRTAMRLYLIAAHLDPRKFGYGSLLAISRLTDRPEEARRCQLMAFLLDPKGDAALPEATAVKPAQLDKKSAQLDKARANALNQFLHALAFYRAGHIEQAKTFAKGVDEAIFKTAGMTDKDTFLQMWCKDGAGAKPVPDNYLRIMVRAEVWTIDQLVGGKKGSGVTNWALILKADRRSRVVPLTLETITRFDPRECLYRNSVWKAP